MRCKGMQTCSTNGMQESITVTVKGHPVILDKDFAEDFDPKLWYIRYNPRRPTEPKAVVTTFYIPGSRTGRGKDRSLKGCFQSVQLHRVVALAKNGQIVDHINQNPCDNRRENLRICSNGVNRQNAKLNANNKSGFKGVYFVAAQKSRPWRAMGCRVPGQKSAHKHLGYFATKEEAANAYNKWTREQFGEYASLNPVKST